jgi:hypothetical protein
MFSGNVVNPDIPQGAPLYSDASFSYAYNTGISKVQGFSFKRPRILSPTIFSTTLATVSAADILNSVVVITNANETTLNLPNASDFVATLDAPVVNMGFPFTVCNATTNSDIILVAGTGGSIVNPSLTDGSTSPGVNISVTVVLTSIVSGQESYVVY